MQHIDTPLFLLTTTRTKKKANPSGLAFFSAFSAGD